MAKKAILAKRYSKTKFVLVIGNIEGNFWDQKIAWFIIDFFAQTRLIWNIVSKGSKNWLMGYIYHLIFIIENKFGIKIEKYEQIQDFEISYNLANSTQRWSLAFIIDYHLQFQ